VGPTFGEGFLYFISALVIAGLPIYLYEAIFDLAWNQNTPLFVVVSVFTSFILVLAHYNTAFATRSRLNRSREDIITKASVSIIKNADGKIDKKSLLAEKRKQQAAITNIESVAFSLLYNNVAFLLLIVVLAFYVFRFATAPYNYVLSVSLAAGILSISSAYSV